MEAIQGRGDPGTNEEGPRSPSKAAANPNQPETSPLLAYVHHNGQISDTQFTACASNTRSESNRPTPKVRDRQAPQPPNNSLHIYEEVLFDTDWHWSGDRYLRLTLLPGQQNGQRIRLSETLVFHMPGYSRGEDPPDATAVGALVKVTPPKLNPGTSMAVESREVAVVH